MNQSRTLVHIKSAFLAAMLTLMSGHAHAQPSGPVTQVTAAFTFTCALTTLGAVACWGYNGLGQLGDQTNTTNPLPVAVYGLNSGVIAVAGGGNHACALTAGGGVKCWGDNVGGQLGNATSNPSNSPVDVYGLASGVAAIAVGRQHSCALTVVGGVKCWGLVIGYGNAVFYLTAYDVPDLTSGVVTIAARGDNTCAITDAGGLKCWGLNSSGQIGDGTTGDHLLPTAVTGMSSGVSAVAVGASHICALMKASGGVKCWGANATGQVGDGSNVDRNVPVDVVGLGSGVVAIAAGGSHSCAIMTGGKMKCWGFNSNGQLGDNSGIDQTNAVDVIGLGSPVAAISVGENHSCALTVGGNAKCWGEGLYGQLGYGATTHRNLPTGVSGLSVSGIAQLGLGQSHTCALSHGGAVKCWGLNSAGELGNNSTVQSLQPVEPVGLGSGVASLTASKFHSCAVTTSGATKCWGQNTNGSLGDGTQIDRYVPIDVSGLGSGMVSTTVGSNHTCALTSAGGGRCWGGNSDGVLGDGTYNQRLFQVAVQQGANTYLAISAGDSVTCALVFGGVVQCWGSNLLGQLGLGTPIPPAPPGKTNVPGNVLGLPDIAMMDAGGSHACAVSIGGAVKCWGRGSDGELGNGGFVASSTPVNVSGLGSGVLAVSSGTYHNCALTSAGEVKCWGYNFYKQLGNGLDTPSAVPVDVVGLATGVTAVEASLSHTCAITTPGGVKCWGYNLNGQLGDNTTTLRGTPVNALIGGQAISFTPPARLLLNLPTALTATSSSGLPITFDTWTPSVCTISGNTVTATTRSLCGIRASQAGMGNISAASQSLHLVPVAFTLDVDASVTATKYDAGTDGLLVSRYMLGLTGPALTSSALGATASRIDPDLIRAYLNDGRFLLDIDGNGKLDAFTDGLLIHRYLLGQRGSALTTGAFDPLGTRTSITDIEAHLLSLLP